MTRARLRRTRNGHPRSVSLASEARVDQLRHVRRPVTGVLGAIGDTPLVELERLLGRSDVRVWAKLEAANPGGSASLKS